MPDAAVTERRVIVELGNLAGREGALVGRGRLTAALGRLAEVHDLVERGVEDFRWPHLLLPDDAALAAVTRTGAELRGRARRLAVAGQPGALAPLRAIVGALSPEAPLRWVDSADAAPADADDLAWLVLEGPPWADALAEAAVAAGRPVAVAGAGEHEAPPDGWWVSDPAAGDGRFGALGLGTLLGAAFAGVDVAALVAGARDVTAACRRPALFENPAYTLAAAFEAAEARLGVSGLAHVVPTGRLRGFGEWVARAWGAASARTAEQDGARRYVGGPGASGVAGDEEFAEALLGGGRDRLLVAWEVEGVDPVPVRVFAQLWRRERMPFLRVRLPGIDATSLGGALQLVAHTTLVTSLLGGRDPFAREAVSAWDAALERARADVDGGARIA
ncbi:MAG: hypothetical protein ACOZNI_16550 [Myxococcota bacterium]